MSQLQHQLQTQLRRAFTLVELLVVIGIISVLISVLLPSLNRARQAANLVDCQARLRQMGQALQIYTVNNHGCVPWGVVSHNESWTDHNLPNPSNQEAFWWWHFTLSEIMQKNILQSDGFVHGISPVFRDQDTIQPPQEARYVNHYTANPRILYNAREMDQAPFVYSNQTAPPITPPDLTPRKVASIKPSGVFVIWDAPQIVDYGYNAYELASELDGNALTYGHCFCLGTPVTTVKYDRPVTPGKLGQNINGKALQKTWNRDLQTAFEPGVDAWRSHLRFRHMNNTRLAALCLDGHVETREVGTCMVKDFCTNYR
jgi:prepilin-type N-terminal cleavage/methylation domain-containing protein